MDHIWWGVQPNLAMPGFWVHIVPQPLHNRPFEKLDKVIYDPWDMRHEIVRNSLQSRSHARKLKENVAREINNLNHESYVIVHLTFNYSRRPILIQ